MMPLDLRRRFYAEEIEATANLRSASSSFDPVRGPFAARRISRADRVKHRTPIRVTSITTWRLPSIRRVSCSTVRRVWWQWSSIDSR